MARAGRTRTASLVAKTSLPRTSPRRRRFPLHLPVLRPAGSRSLTRSFLGGLLALATIASHPREAWAQAPVGNLANDRTAQAVAPRLVEVRLAMSGAAAENLSDARMRQLLEIELQDNAILAPGRPLP